MLVGAIAYVVMVVVMVGFFVKGWQEQIDLQNYRARGAEPTVAFGVEHALKACCFALLWPILLPFIVGGFIAMIAQKLRS